MKRMHNVGDFLNKSPWAGWKATTSSLGEVLETHRLQPQGRAERRSRTSSCASFISHFSSSPPAQRGLRVSRPAGRGLRIPDQADFADSAGKKGGEFYTPRSVVRMMVRLLKPEPTTCSVYDPCVGSGGMLILAKEYVDEHGGDGTPADLCSMAGGQRHRVVHRQDEHAAARHQHADLRNDDTLAEPQHTVDGRRADALRPRAVQPTVLHQLGHGRQGSSTASQSEEARVPRALQATARCRWAARRPT